MNTIQIRRDCLFNEENEVHARTDMTSQKPIRDLQTQKLFGFEPFVSCSDSDAEIWLIETDLVLQLPSAHNLVINVFYSKPEEREDAVGFRAA